ncbi:hypothetical protein DPMN_095772 [Dreissena polymorpha]|uniref:Uncharacterized protein n=1 Tax=Dreissena polymorpha TaxID=45954 RepID=A0A9D4L8N9_DREPO|nr:hypothetical protein DPMN_095772 [Dreissena polymorpha]
MENPHLNHNKTGQLYTRLPETKPQILPPKLPANRIPSAHPFLTGIGECSVGPVPARRHRQARASPAICDTL